MISKFKPKTEFSKNVLTLMTGTTIAQAIPIAISPILTRIYTPEEFGIFALYIAIASILAVIATGRYEMAIILPKKDVDSINIVILSIMISFIVSFICFLIVFIFNSQITELLRNPEISNWLYFIPLTVLLTGVYQSFNYWLNRKKEYKRLAVSRVAQSSSTAGLNLGMGFAGLGSSGLVIGQVLGQSFATIILGKIFYENEKQKFLYIKRLKLLAMLKRYIKFPKYDILSSALNVSSHKLTHVMINVLYGSAIGGYFYLMQRIVSLPLTFISSAIADVFRQSATDAFHKKMNCKQIYLATFKKLFILSLLPALVLYFYSIELFVFIFGEQWKIAGEYAEIFAPVLMIQFISSPLSIVFYIVEKQHINLLLQFFLLIFILFSLFISNNATDAVIYLSITMGLYYLIQLILSSYYAGIYKSV